MLKIDNLHTVLDTDSGLVRAVEALSLSIDQGETFALVGESGCGKSMTALSILRLLPDNGRVAEGSVRIDGTDLTRLPEARMRDVRGRRIGIIFQEPATSLNPVLRVGDQIVEVIERHTPLRGAAARAKAIEWLQRVGIPEPARRSDDYPFQMSGGQKQRVMIAIALAAEPDLLIADEPTTALDVTIQKQILELLRDLQRERRMALLLITHDLGIVAQMAHRIALMYAGQIVEVARVEAFLAHPRHPYAQMLFAALPDTGKRGQALAAIPGTVPPLDREFAGCRFVDRCPRAFAACGSTTVELLESGPTHQVRCLLYQPTGRPDAVETSLAALRANSSGHAPARGSVAAADSRREAGGSGTPLPAGKAAGTGAATQSIAQSAASHALLDVRDYRVWFPIRAGLLRRTVGYVKAVDGVSFTLSGGRTLALVGESGCG
ncbi:MAG TPA: oligopeptide/dipeptide ABC transporter ATP-binding protein, partial [Burkholderiaceae bacterium]|nr:oligopeptide/dipeptide ABC transporter ATP-binding protein [Burkholderiaceae bacterium]